MLKDFLELVKIELALLEELKGVQIDNDEYIKRKMIILNEISGFLLVTMDGGQK